MHATVTIEPSALWMPGVPSNMIGQLNRNLLSTLRAHGRLVFASDDEVTTFIRIVKSSPDLPVATRTEWIALLTEFRKSRRMTVLKGHVCVRDCDSIAAIRHDWEPDADVAVVDDSLGIALGLEAVDGLDSDPDHGPDVAVAATAPDSPRIQRYRSLHAAPFVPRDSTREEFWRSVLQPLARGTVAATVLDGYLFNRLWAIKHRRPWARSQRDEQCAWLIRKFDAVVAVGSTLRLIGNEDLRDYPDETAGTTAFALKSMLDGYAPKRIHRIEVVLAHPPRGSRFPHNRHVRFGNGTAISVHDGFDRFSKPSIDSGTDVQWNYLWNADAMRNLERDEGLACDLSAESADLA